MSHNFQFKKMLQRGPALLAFVVAVGLAGTLPNVQSAEKVKPQFHSVQIAFSPSIPDSLTFAGEPVPLENFDTYESLDRELIINTYFHSQTIRLIKLAPRYLETIEFILKQNGIPDDFKYLAMAESALNHKAVSPSGAAGIWQFMKTTGKEYGLEINDEVDERYHLEKATQAACDYLKASYRKYRNWTLVAASFNAGQGGVDRFIGRQKEGNYYDLLMADETMRYVFRILALKLIISDPHSYGFDVDPTTLYKPVPYRTDSVSGPIESLADYARSNGTNYKLLKELNPWLRETSLKNPNSKTYYIKIPVKREL